MSRKFRTFLFGFFVSLFAAAAPALVLYAQGYRVNWPIEPGKKLIVKTGGFFVKASPKQVDIYVNGKLEKQTEFFFDSALVGNLLPRQYKFEIKKSGYQTWGKNLGIKEKEVTEARNITLFPDHLDLTGIEKDVKSVLPSPDGQEIALQESNEDGWSLKLYDISQNITLKLADQDNFPGKNPDFNSWNWSGAKTLEVHTDSAAASSTYTIATDKNPPRITKTPQTNATSTQASANIKNGNKYYLGQDGFVYKNDTSGNPAKAGSAQINPTPGTPSQLWSFGDYFFVRSGSDLYAANSSLGSFTKIFNNLTGDPKLSPDGRKVTYASDSEIWVFFLKENTTQPAAAAGDKIFIARFSEKISDCDWFNSDYLIFAAGNSIKTAEIDNRDRTNIVSLAKLSDIPSGQGDNQNQKIFWNAGQKTVYLFYGNNFYKSQAVE